jgi:hypothetical protein
MQNLYNIDAIGEAKRMVATGAYGLLAGTIVIHPDTGEHEPLGVHWARSLVDQNIMNALGRDPGAMTHLEYWQSTPSALGLCQRWVFDRELAVEWDRKHGKAGGRVAH